MGRSARVGTVITAAVVGALAASGGRARADAGSDRASGEGPRAAEVALRDGSFSPWTMPARAARTDAFASGIAGYDSARGGPIAEARAEVHLFGPVALRGGASYSNDSGRMRPEVGARVGILREEAHGIDAALGVFYRAEGFDEPEGEIETFACASRSLGRLAAAANLVYGQDPEGRERDGELRASLVRRSDRFALGLDARLRLSLGVPQTSSARAEAAFDAVGGPVAMVVVGPLVVLGQVGPSAVKMRDTSPAFGVAAFAGLGSAF
jgi:hypothetical protein